MDEDEGEDEDEDEDEDEEEDEDAVAVVSCGGVGLSSTTRHSVRDISSNSFVDWKNCWSRSKLKKISTRFWGTWVRVTVRVRG